MGKQSKSVLESVSKKRRVGLAVLLAATVVASASLAGSVGGKGDESGSPSTQAVDAFIWFEKAGTVMTLEVKWDTSTDKPQVFEIKDFSFGVENPTTIGSATGGAGAGKIKFNEFQIKKTSDSASPMFFKTAAAGMVLPYIELTFKKVDDKGREMPFMKFRFETVFTTKIDWSGPGDEGPEESITFVYGKLGVKYIEQNADGTSRETVFMWDQVTNKSDPWE